MFSKPSTSTSSLLKLPVGAGCLRQWVQYKRPNLGKSALGTRLINGRVINSSRVVAFESFFIPGLLAKSLAYVSSAPREKEEKESASEASRAVVREEERVRPTIPFPLPNPPLVSLRSPIFFCRSTPFWTFFPLAEPGPRLGACWLFPMHWAKVWIDTFQGYQPSYKKERVSPVSSTGFLFAGQWRGRRASACRMKAQPLSRADFP